jgi:hypothetical protein
MLGASDGVDSFTEDSTEDSLRGNPKLAFRRYLGREHEQLVNNPEESGSGVVANRDFAAAIGSDVGARIRHRVFAGVRNSHGGVRGGCDCVEAECAGDSGGELFGNAAAVYVDAAAGAAGRSDVFIGATVHAWRDGDAHAGGVAGDCGTDGTVVDFGFDACTAEGSGAGGRAGRVRLSE